MWLVMCVLMVAVGTGGMGLTEEEYAQFPKLFHLDDYEACLARRTGLYCLGDFQLAPRGADRTFQNMLEYSKNHLNFNRTVIHRGYCVSSRCPLDRAERAEQDERNGTFRFERCVDSWARTRGFQSSIKAVQYCHTAEQKTSTIDMNTPKLAFLMVVFVILLFNLIGTTYDIGISDDKKKSSVLVAWSVRSNWRRLTASYEDGDPRLTALTPMQGVRVIIMLLEIILHTGFLYYRLYTHNSKDLENLLKNPIVMLIRNGTAAVQVFVVLSSFLLSYNLLLHWKNHEFNLAILPKCILNRLVRITPVHLLAVGFAATWWPTMGEGPMWSTVEAEGAMCTRKFWAHALYVHNFFNVDEQCLLPTWFLAVDMQLFIIGSALTLLLTRWPSRVLPILGALIAGSVLLNAGLAFYYQWDTTLYYMNPENNRAALFGITSFKYFYIAPWGSLPACFIGLFLAHLHFQLQEQGFKCSEHKWLGHLCEASIPVTAALVMTGLVTQDITSRAWLSVSTAVERPIFSGMAALCLFGLFNNVQFSARSLFAWRFWHVLGRLSLPALMLHWFLIMSFLSSSSLPLHHSHMNLVWDFVGTAFLTYVLAVPLAILVEIPIQRFTSALI